MNIYNKLYIFLLSIFYAQNSNSISIDPIEIRSSINDLLYAELKFTQAQPNQILKVSLANEQDLNRMNAKHAPPNQLNFFRRYYHHNTGIITITSTQPVTTPKLNMIIKIEDGANVRLQHIQQYLSPDSDPTSITHVSSTQEQKLFPFIIGDKKNIFLHSKTIPQAKKNSHDLKNNITFYSTQQNQPLVISKSSLPILNQNTLQTNQNRALLSSHHVKSHALSTTLLHEYILIPLKTVPPQLNILSLKTNSIPNIYQSMTSNIKPTSTNRSLSSHHEQISTPIRTKYTVKNNESLGKIASQISFNQKKIIFQIMQKIYTHNRAAFIQGNINKIKQGAILDLQVLSSATLIHHHSIPHKIQPSSQIQTEIYTNLFSKIIKKE